MEQTTNHPKIPTYIINVKERTDRLAHIQQQFSDKPEFDISIVEAVKHNVGSVGLWQSTMIAIKMAQQRGEPYLLICEDDHEFTDHYDIQKLLYCIQDAKRRNADILLGAVNWFNSILKVSADLFWVDKFTATQFLVIYEKFFDTLLNVSFNEDDDSDLKISGLTDHKMILYPFMSTQKEFGYSDIRQKSNAVEPVHIQFEQTSSVIRKMENIFDYYQSMMHSDTEQQEYPIDGITIPTYILHSPSPINQSQQINEQFKNRCEFETIDIFTDELQSNGMTLWKAHCKAIDMAIKNDHDVIILCEEDHEFTANYSADYLLKNIIQAYEQGADLLYGSCLDFGMAVPISANRFWINQILSTQFVVVYKSLFNIIMNYKFEDENPEQYALSNLTNSKHVLYPAVSTKADIDGAYNLKDHLKSKQLADDMRDRTDKRMKKINEAHLRYR